MPNVSKCLEKKRTVATRNSGARVSYVCTVQVKAEVKDGKII